MGQRKNRYGFVLAFCAFMAAGGMFTAVQAAAPDARPGCDPEFMDAIEARAWLHGQRRISQNQSLIYKPDSVLEYSCFNQYLGYLAANPQGRRFSENHPPYPTWPVVSGISDTSLDFALFEVVYNPLVSYLGSNFGHTFLGGRTVDAGGQAPQWGQFNCSAMSYVWRLARCSDFAENEQGTYNVGDDEFYDFPWYAANDPRRLPAEYEACRPPEQQIRAAMIETYRGEGQDGQHGTEWESFVLMEENTPAIDTTQYEEDPIPTDVILDFVLPGDCAQSAVVPTGVMIEIPSDNIEHQEFVCSKPACSYDGSACVE